MGEKRGDFDISITADAVDVRLTPSLTSPHAKRFGVVFTIVALLGFNAGVIVLPGKHGRPSMWHDMANATWNTWHFQFPLSLLLVGTLLMGWMVYRYGRAAWPSDQIFHVDHTSVTISRVPWLDLSNTRWRTLTVQLANARNFRYAVIGSARGAAYFGIRFRARSNRWVLPGLNAPDAKEILDGLKALGADVPDDPKLEKRIKEWHENQFGNTD